MITEIKIKGVASYENEVIISELKKVNFFFGNNGSGKSTIAKFLHNESLDTNNKISDYNNCSQIGFENLNNEILVFNEEFIEKNFINSNIQKGIFSLNQGNEAIDTLIEDENDILKQNEKYKNENLKIEKDNIQNDINKKNKNVKDKCFELRRNTLNSFLKIRDSFPYKQTQNNFEKINSIILKNEILNEVKYDDLLAKYKKIYEDDIDKINSFLSYKIYRKIRKLEIELNEVLKEVIIGNNDVDIAKMIEKLGLRKWVETGRDFIIDNSQTCPFCQKETIDKDLLEKFENYFDENYKNKIDKIKQLKTNYDEIFKQYFAEINILVSEYNFENIVSNLEKDINTLHNENLKIINEKIENTNEKKEIKSIFKYKDTISKINENIKLHNEDFENLDANKKDFKEKIWNYLAFNCKSEIESYIIEEYEASINYLFQLKIEENINEMITDSRTKIDNWKEQTVTTQDAVNNINSILRNTGFQGFEIEEIEKVNNISKYALKRLVNSSHQNVFKTLSEGEKNFIAFLYFYQLCLGTDSSDNNLKKKIIVIDDPVSSLDNQSLFIITTLIRDLAKKKGNSPNHKLFYYENIEQIFILTHNIYFYKEAILDFGKKLCYDTSYFRIEKVEKSSRINSINHNEIDNDYSLLWKTLKNLKNSTSNDLNIIICNLMRRILESYINFTKIGKGKDSWDVLSKIPIEDPRHFVFSALISDINDASHKISPLDDLYFQRIMNISTENMFFVFEEIFKEIGETHYDAMMN